MVQWTNEEKAAIASVWDKVDVDSDGHNALGRLFLTYPWTQKYFSTFGNLSSAAAIAGNAEIRAHGKKVLSAIGNAFHHLDDVKHTLAALSKQHDEELHMDPENFKRFGEVLMSVLADKVGATFTPQVQVAWNKFINVLAISK